MPARRLHAVALLLAAGLALAGCGSYTAPPRAVTPSPEGSSATPTAGATPTPTPAASALVTPSPEPSATPIAIPTDCRSLLTADVLTQLGKTPLNDPAVGGGVQADGSLVCNWRDPKSDTTGISTRISKLSQSDAATLFATLQVDQKFDCYPENGGSRCGKTWKDATYPVMDGRTVFWKDGVLLDTLWSNLAPTGYTAAIVAHLWG